MKRWLLALLLAPALCAADTGMLGGVATAYRFNPLVSGTRGTAVTAQAYVEPESRRWNLAVGYVGPQFRDQWREIPGYFYVAGEGRLRLPAEFYLGLGASLRQSRRGIDYLLPSALNFSLSIGADVGRARVELRHFSNANTRGENRGENLFLIGWRFE